MHEGLPQAARHGAYDFRPAAAPCDSHCLAACGGNPRGAPSLESDTCRVGRRPPVRTHYLEDGSNTEVTPKLTVENVVPVQAFSPENCPDLVDSEAVAQVGKATCDSYFWNNRLHETATWDARPNHIGHQESLDRFRCHNNRHTADDLEKIG